MIENDTIKLLRECDAGVKMGMDSIDEVLKYAAAAELKDVLKHCRTQHERLSGEIQDRLNRFHDEGKDPNPIVQGMSWLKTEAKLVMRESDHTIADLMTDGCHMGIKSLNRYLNQYQAAEEFSKDVTKRLIHQEEQLATELRPFL